MEDNFLLISDYAQKLYQKYARKLPIIDYHNHLAVEEAIGEKHYSDIFEIWIQNDPYKHRAMRICGVPEKYITGDAAPYEKFVYWCKIFPDLIGNPLYIWSKMELKNIFSLEVSICEDNAQFIWEETRKLLSSGQITSKSVLEKFGVEMLCPCAALDDDISIYEAIANAAPSLRADSVLLPDAVFLKRLESRFGVIACLADYHKIVIRLLDEFERAGCKFTDHALDDGFRFLPSKDNGEQAFMHILEGKADENDRMSFMSEMLIFLGNEYAKRGMTMQLHIGALRSTSTRLRALCGPAGGYAGIGSPADVSYVTKLLDAIEQTENGLPKVILFTLNPAAHSTFAVLSGSYSKDGVSGLVTLGPAWWWCDHLQGITDALESTSAFSVLKQFTGMTTDSRSILSFGRHDYFRRVLCSYLAQKQERNELCCEEKDLGELITAVCYGNAKRLI